MRRRNFLSIAALLLLAPGVSLAQEAAPKIAVVELINFQCPRCRAVNDQYDRLKAAADQAGVDFRVAPVAWSNQSLWPDRVFYAARDLFPGTESLIRDELFGGIQTDGLRFDEVSQVVSYFERRQIERKARAIHPKFNLLDVVDRAITDLPLFSELKALRLAELSGATEVPVFIWIKEGEIIKTISPADAAEANPLVLKVHQAIATTGK